MKKLISRRQFMAAAGVAVAAGALTACGGSSASTAGSAAGSAAAASGDTIKVGVMGPLTGDASYKHLSIKQENIDLYYKNKPRTYATVPNYVKQ